MSGEHICNRSEKGRIGRFLATPLFALLTATLALNVHAVAPDCSQKSIRCVGPGQEYNTSVGHVEAAFQSAVDQAKAGDFIKIQGGTYTHNESTSPTKTFLEINVSGAAGQPITIEPFEGEKVTIEGFGYTEGTLGPSRTNERLIDVRGDYIHIYDMELSYSSRYGVVISGTNGHFERVTAHDSWNDNFLIAAAGAGDEFVVENNVLRYCHAYRSRHNFGIRLEIGSNKVAFHSNNIIENCLSHDNGYQPDGQKVPPIDGDPAGGGNSDGILLGKGCHDLAAGAGVANLCLNNIVRNNILWGNADDGLDTSAGAGTQIIDNISFNNGPEGNKGFKMLRTVAGPLFMGNVAAQNDSRGFELRFETTGYAYHNLGFGHPLHDIYVAGSGPDVKIYNNVTASLSKTNPDFSIPSGIDDKTNWATLGDGAPKLINSIDTNTINLGLNTTPIKPRLIFIREQFREALSPVEGSPLIDKGTFITGIHCITADDDPTNPMVPTDQCRHWNGKAPDIGAYEYPYKPYEESVLLNPPNPPVLIVDGL